MYFFQYIYELEERNENQSLLQDFAWQIFLVNGILSQASTEHVRAPYFNKNA